MKEGTKWQKYPMYTGIPPIFAVFSAAFERSAKVWAVQMQPKNTDSGERLKVLNVMVPSKDSVIIFWNPSDQFIE